MSKNYDKYQPVVHAAVEDAFSDTSVTVEKLYTRDGFTTRVNISDDRFVELSWSGSSTRDAVTYEHSVCYSVCRQSDRHSKPELVGGPATVYLSGVVHKLQLERVRVQRTRFSL